MAPIIRPQDPKKQGSAWGEVRCIQTDCPAQPRVRDGETVSDYRGSDAYKDIAIARWNDRIPCDRCDL